jgi:hypothetical protein
MGHVSSMNSEKLMVNVNLTLQLAMKAQLEKKVYLFFF